MRANVEISTWPERITRLRLGRCWRGDCKEKIFKQENFEGQMDQQGEDCLNLSTRGIVHKGCEDNCAPARIEEGFAEGTRLGNENADVFHQSSGEGAEQVAQSRIGESEDTSF